MSSVLEVLGQIFQQVYFFIIVFISGEFSCTITFSILFCIDFVYRNHYTYIETYYFFYFIVFFSLGNIIRDILKLVSPYILYVLSLKIYCSFLPIFLKNSFFIVYLWRAYLSLVPQILSIIVFYYCISFFLICSKFNHLIKTFKILICIVLS